MDELVFAIPTDELWNLMPYNEKAFIEGNMDLLQQIVQKGLFRKRAQLEEDPSFKQIIPYAVISHNDSYYVFKRTSGQTEKRLQNKLTIGSGGHMNPGNFKDNKKQYIIDEIKRELFEEVNLLNECVIKDIIFIGFINDDTIPVGRFHIGLLYNIRLSNKNVSVNETDKLNAEWIHVSNFTSYYQEMESWSQLAYDQYIKR